MLKVKTDHLKQKHVSFHQKLAEGAVCPMPVNCSSSATGLLPTRPDRGLLPSPCPSLAAASLLSGSPQQPGPLVLSWLFPGWLSALHCSANVAWEVAKKDMPGYARDTVQLVAICLLSTRPWVRLPVLHKPNKTQLYDILFVF